MGVLYALDLWEYSSTSLICVFVWWLAFAIVTYGTSLAYWQRKWPTLADRNYRKDVRDSFLFALGGPLAAFCFVGKDHDYGIMFSANRATPKETP
jgi:hypothetical protein